MLCSAREGLTALSTIILSCWAISQRQRKFVCLNLVYITSNNLGIGRELKAHFMSAASPKYHAPDTWHILPSHIILTLGCTKWVTLPVRQRKEESDKWDKGPSPWICFKRGKYLPAISQLWWDQPSEIFSRRAHHPTTKSFSIKKGSNDVQETKHMPTQTFEQIWWIKSD